MKKILAALAATCAMTVAAHAADIMPAPVLEQNMWFVKAGGSYVMPDSQGYPPAFRGTRNMTAGNAFTGSLEVGRFLTDRISVSLAGGIPPTHELSLNGVDTGKSVTLGAVALDAQFHLLNTENFDAYVGGGLAYNIYFSSTDALVTGIDNGFAPVLQAGVEYKVDPRWGIFADVKKEFYSTTVHHAALGNWQERLDPLVVTAGVAFHF